MDDVGEENKEFVVKKKNFLQEIVNELDQIQGVTLEERAKIVLLTPARTPDETKKAYRKLSNECHPDKPNGNKEKFQVINEAYTLLSKGLLPKKPLLSDDKLLLKITGRKISPLIDQQKKWEKYERCRRNHFYGVGVI